MKKIYLLIATLFLSATLYVTVEGVEKGSMAMEEVPAMEMEGSGSVAMEEEVLDDAHAMIASSEQAIVMIKGTSQAPELDGQVMIAETEEGIMVLAEIKNIPGSGMHGIHIHANGSCDDDGKAAGGHFNPRAVDHGFLPEDTLSSAHAGDMGNLGVDENGSGSFMVFLPDVTLSAGETSVAGKAIILHALEDDFGQPTGNAGARIGCGIIKAN